MVTYEEIKQLMLDSKAGVDEANTSIAEVLVNAESSNSKLDEILVYIRNLQQGSGPVTTEQWEELTGMVGELKTSTDGAKTSAQTAKEKTAAVLTEIDALDEPPTP